MCGVIGAAILGAGVAFLIGLIGWFLFWLWTEISSWYPFSKLSDWIDTLKEKIKNKKEKKHGYNN